MMRITNVEISGKEGECSSRFWREGLEKPSGRFTVGDDVYKNTGSGGIRISDTAELFQKGPCYRSLFTQEFPIL